MAAIVVVMGSSHLALRYIHWKPNNPVDIRWHLCTKCEKCVEVRVEWWVPG